MTPSWDSLLPEESLAALLPAGYRYLARPIIDGLVVFLSGLAEEDQRSILLAQAQLPSTATFAERLGRLAHGCPVLQKLGQILARDRRISSELRQQLCLLESMPPSVSVENMRTTLETELGPLDQRGITLQPPALAEASVAVVIPFSLDQPDRSGLSSGVFKILKPGIEGRLEQELGLLDRVGSHLDTRCEELGIPHLDYQESFQQVRDKLWDEVHLENEQRHLQEAAAVFANEPRVQIPQRLDHCTQRVTAMERMTGRQVTDHRLPAKERQTLARLIAEVLIAQPIFSSSRLSLFHADPHAGNLWLTEEGRLAILDWSLVGRLGENERVAVGQMLLSAVTLDENRMMQLLLGLAERGTVDTSQLQGVVQKWLRCVRYGQFPGMNWLTGLLDEATQQAGLRVHTDLMLFRKTLLTLDGVVRDVGEKEGTIDATMAFEFLRRFAIEWPRRWSQLPLSRDCSTRLSNFDLTTTMLTYPAAAARFWAGYALDLYQTFAGTPFPTGSPVTRSKNGR